MKFEQICIELAVRLHGVVHPKLGGGGMADIVGEAHSGDYTYAIDEDAESVLGDFVNDLGRTSGLRLAYYSEDRGLVDVHTDPQYVFIIDPIDGTRPTICGLESSCVSVAMAPLDNEVTLGNVAAACLVEIKSGVILSAEAGGPVNLRRRAISDTPEAATRLSTRIDLSRMFWATEMCGRPSQALQATLGDMLNASSFAGACFVFNSASYAISRVVLGQLDAYVDFFAALLNRPGGDKWENLSASLFRGKVFGLFPYDIAAAAFLAIQSRAHITDALGQPLDSLKLLKSDRSAISSAVVAGNAELGSQILRYIDKGLANADNLTF